MAEYYASRAEGANLSTLKFRDGMDINTPIRYSRKDLKELIRTPGLLRRSARWYIEMCISDGVIAAYLVGIGNGFRKSEEIYYHREDGPAMIFADGRLDWYHNGKLLKRVMGIV